GMVPSSPPENTEGSFMSFHTPSIPVAIKSVYKPAHQWRVSGLELFMKKKSERLQSLGKRIKDDIFEKCLNILRFDVTFSKRSPL
ncbi:MAG: hypothetical protein JWO58_1070, partial [Chitinophagaceae bacterium]|nr:hypothetical protein [Chitinophagaceae bacterium]